LAILHECVQALVIPVRIGSINSIDLARELLMDGAHSLVFILKARKTQLLEM